MMLARLRCLRPAATSSALSLLRPAAARGVATASPSKAAHAVQEHHHDGHGHDDGHHHDHHDPFPDPGDTWAPENPSTFPTILAVSLVPILTLWYLLESDLSRNEKLYAQGLPPHKNWIARGLESIVTDPEEVRRVRNDHIVDESRLMEQALRLQATRDQPVPRVFTPSPSFTSPNPNNVGVGTRVDLSKAPAWARNNKDLSDV